MSNKIQLEILGYFKRKRADGTKISSTEELIMYIDSQIGIIVLNLDSSVFQKEFLPSLWEAVIFVCINQLCCSSFILNNSYRICACYFLN